MELCFVQNKNNCKEKGTKAQLFHEETWVKSAVDKKNKNVPIPFSATFDSGHFGQFSIEKVLDKYSSFTLPISIISIINIINI